MAQNNQTIIESVYLAGTNDFQQRVPDPTQAGVAATMDAIFDPMNRMYYNQFIDILVNRVGMTYIRGSVWKNKLARFKGAKLNYGSSMQEIAPKWIKAHSYEDDAETLLKLHRPEAANWFHSQNRRDKYPITINPTELRTAFENEYGLNDLVAKIMLVPMNSDEYDEYRIMMQLTAEYENRWGFFKHHLDTVPTDEASGKEFLTAIKTYAGKLQFPSSVYNSSAITDIPVFAQPDELILLVTPETSASVDVNTLAVLFNMDKAEETKVTKVIVDEFPIPNAIALLTTEDFFVCSDTLYETASFNNPETLGTTYYLHHWGVYSVSPFVPAILFTTDADTTVPVITQNVTGITVTPDSAYVLPGGDVALNVELQGSITPTGTNVKVAPNAATYEVTSTAKLNSVTRVDNYGVLHVQKSGIADGTVINIKVTSTYINPSGATTEYTATTSVTVGTEPSAPVTPTE